MKSPKLYKVINLTLNEIIGENNIIVFDARTYIHHLKYQQDNMMFRIIRNITNNNEIINKDIIFVDCKSGKTKRGELEEIILNGFWFNGEHFVIGESSASMTRAAQLSFINKKIENSVNKIIEMDNVVDKTVVSKMRAYRGLLLSSCHMMPDGWFPKIVIIDEKINIIKNQKIKYLETTSQKYKDKETNEEKKYDRKEIKEGRKDIRVNCFDGFSIGSPNLFKHIENTLGFPSSFNAFILRMPYMKGLCVKFDYAKFYQDMGVETIKDIWGNEYSIYDDLIIADISLYKGYKYFNKYNDYRDWDYYNEKVKKYNHVFGVAKYNFSKEEEKIYTRGNYQILQDLELDGKSFNLLAKKTLEHFENIIFGEEIYMLYFLGLFADRHKESSNFMKSILKNKHMMKEEGVKKHVINLLKGYINDAKCGKIYLNGCFKFATPDIIAFAEHAASLKVEGCLESGEMWSYGKINYKKGKNYLIERNPHISKSEHLKIRYEINDKIIKYIGNLENICMIDIKSIHMARLNGCDFDKLINSSVELYGNIKR